MDWIELSVTVNHEAELFVTEVLQEVGSNGVAIEDSSELAKEREDRFGEIFALNPNDYPAQHMVIKGYFNALQYNEALKQKIITQLRSTSLVDESVLQVTDTLIQESDWENEWKNYFHPFQASERFYIVPSWEDVERDKTHLYIELDPGMAFGTGDHPTTSMCLKALEETIQPHHQVIDVGTGSGILSIAAYLLGAQSIKAIDLDEMAIKVAQENFEKNNCLHVIDTATGNLLIGETKHYDVVIANILAHIIEKMVKDAYNCLNPDGYFIASGIIEEKRETIQSLMEETGFVIKEVKHDQNWICIIGQKVK
ncbi:50S ribosomal protein L11 methyltransferase [Staphylococcus lutrae]|uniref:Ribosomal protein L11 methyltransferase n=1 Tax=Staphylococcus lutrae TaxID=155085 RepID=A0AAC9WIE8_9STAP|nr:50S ribosomal protein L11 methyltransferase [Staphylococcus lutrae]ARJ49890.1 ribosomal protein L11 methyltransferase [Staphylococcus lutrae]PNZ38635.1 50S ribosomal protein L11 methyltransferase [Staphylococcus lutrae]